MDVVLIPLFNVLIIAIELYVHIVIIGVIISWLVAFGVLNTHNRLVQLVNDFVERITQPAYRYIRRYIPPVGGLDLSPMILILGLYFVVGVLQRLLLRMM